ncbi:MAG: type IV secretory system conjugative DNA transfer family protein [Hyphomonadaceae bacterium]
MQKDMGPSSEALATARWADPEFVAGRYEFKPGQFWLGRHPHHSEIPIGYLDDRHVLMCAGNRSGKGRSLIINNMAIWPGSIASYDPKGDLATILAPRRGRGNEYCDGMGQDVFVLDPKRAAEVDESYRGYFNPLDALDPEDDDFLIWCDRIANVIVKKTEGTESAHWVDKAKIFISMLIAHVASSPHYQGQERSLLTVYRFCQEGHYDYAKRLTDASGKTQDPFVLLLTEIEDNNAGNGQLKTLARSFATDKSDQPKLFNSVRNEAAMQLAFLKSQSIMRVIAPPEDESAGRALDMRRLKSDPKGVAVFVVLPTEDSEEFSRWANTVFLCLFAAARQQRGQPASGHQTLCVLDEFLDLGKNDYIASALRNIAGAGVKLVIVVQGLGELNGFYKEGADAFFTNSGVKLFFGDTGREGNAYIEKTLGETQIVMTVYSASESASRQTSASDSYAFGENSSTSESDTTGENWQRSRTDTTGAQWSKTRGWNDSVNWGSSKNWGRSEGDSAGRNYGPHVFFQPLDRATSYGTSLNHSSGEASSRGHQRGRNGASTRGGQRSTANTTSTGGQSSTTHTSQSGQSQTWTQTSSTTEGYTVGGGTAEQFHKKPLLAAHEAQSYLRAFSDVDIDHPAYPGLMLVMISGELPFFLRRSNYDQDPYFVRCFSPDPGQTYIPIEKQPLLGHEYTEEHIWQIKLPKLMLDDDYEGAAKVRKHARFANSDILFAYHAPSVSAQSVAAPLNGTVVDLPDEEERKTSGAIMTIRAEWPIRENEQTALKRSFFGKPIAAIKNRIEEKRLRAEAEAAAKRQAEEAARGAEEAARQERAARQRRIEEEARRRKEEQGQANFQTARTVSFSLISLLMGVCAIGAIVIGAASGNILVGLATAVLPAGGAWIFYDMRR